MTKQEVRKRIATMSEVQAKVLIEEIIIGCIWEGRKMMNSSEILDAVCDTLRERGLDE